MTMTKSAKAVNPLAGAVRALMRSEDSVALKANMRYVWDYFMVHPPGAVRNKFYPDTRSTNKRVREG